MVTCLEDRDAGPVTDVIVPMPILNDEQGSSDRELQYRPFGNWTSLIVVAEDTKTLAFQTTDRNLTDINATFMRTSDQKIDPSRTGLSPIVPGRGTVSQQISGDSTGNTTTRIFLDDEIGGFASGNSPITVTCEIYAGGAISYGSGEPIYRIRFSKVVPDNQRGWIGMGSSVEYYNTVDSRWEPYLGG